MLVTAVRTAAFGVRAAYTVRYKPALAGTWLAFNNAGFGANTATLCLALGTWYACFALLLMSLLPFSVKQRQMSGCCAVTLLTWACQYSGSAAQSTHSMCCLFRINKVGHLYYSKWEQRIYMIWAYILVASVIVFGRLLLPSYSLLSLHGSPSIYGL